MSPTDDPRGGPVSVLLLLDVAPSSLAWGWSRYVVAGRSLGRISGLHFQRQLGTGHENRFGLRPSLSRQALFCVFEDDAAADRFLDASALMDDYRRHARELFTVKLRAYSSRGSWAGQPLPVSAETPTQGPIAALTRASIRPTAAWSFWQEAAATQRSLDAAEGCTLAAGIGEAPLLRQATFTIWQSEHDMDRYARSGAHQQAIQAAYRRSYFSESMFVRFVPYGARGTWKGRSFD